MQTDIGEADLFNRESGKLSQFKVELMRGDFRKWLIIRSEVYKVFKSATRDFLSPEDQTEEQRFLSADFCEPSNRIVLLKDKNSDTLVGFTLAKKFGFSLDLIPLHEREQNVFKMDRRSFVEMYNNHTVEVGWTVILEKFRHQGGWSQMMDVLDESIRQDPDIHYMVRNVRTADRYSEKVRNRYLSKIVYEDENISVFGPQKYFRVKISPLPASLNTQLS
jgi:hypothetical protein